jgi:hypothetical protein
LFALEALTIPLPRLVHQTKVLQFHFPSRLWYKVVSGEHPPVRFTLVKASFTHHFFFLFLRQVDSLPDTVAPTSFGW